ncbi:integrin beta-PS-like [Copidosoma floridanum]|uniref:integrin beta-PS-like n=1 Tax=Copidosoma floridanum TaxID=29053 RepID=UPI0006C9D454|nr:integrin beta-PS-like [Copidosoma floridanum]
MTVNLNWRLPLLLLLLITVVWVTVSSATENTDGILTSDKSICNTKQKCSDCIQTSKCAWCSKPDYNGNRCFSSEVNENTDTACPSDSIFNPSSELSMKNNKSDKIEYDLHLQEFNLKVRINEAQKIKIKFVAGDYPVDLYYLMDLSNSMKDDKEKLSSLSELLAQSMRNITSNFRLGFGSFVDKVVLPFTDTSPKALESSCTSCAPPYGFKNHMNLSDDSNKFANEVKNAPTSGNIDAPEGGFDGLMQAMVCDEIGWRKEARKLLLFSTDASFHYAGDGRLGGIVEPNDGKCHMKNNMYTHSTILDYPSISHINVKAKEKAINIIWAVTADYISIYEKLAENVQSSHASVLKADSSNIVDLVRDQYNKIRSSVEMRHNLPSTSDHITVNFLSKCLNGDGAKANTNKCSNLKTGDAVEFEVEITVTKCPESRSEWNKTFLINPIGMSESVAVNLETICECECKDEPSMEGSSLCNGHGRLECGICACDPNFFGKNCECDASQATRNDEFACRPNNETTEVCSNRGECVCNRCECAKRDDSDEVVEGAYCEKDNFSCGMGRQGKLCSGHGKCRHHGRCECDSDWYGDACEKYKNTEACESNGKMCSERGSCETKKDKDENHCVCRVVDGIHYFGEFCEKCRNCPKICESLNPCVSCVLKNTTDCNDTCRSDVIHDVTEKLGQMDVGDGRVDCDIIHDDNKCKYRYIYYNDTNNNIVILAEKTPIECPREVNVLAIVLGVVAAVVFIGLALLLLWKLVITIADRREYARFEKERANAKWDNGGNPIFQQATSSFQNPMYSKGQS